MKEKIYDYDPSTISISRQIEYYPKFLGIYWRDRYGNEHYEKSYDLDEKWVRHLIQKKIDAGEPWEVIRQNRINKKNISRADYVPNDPLAKLKERIDKLESFAKEEKGRRAEAFMRSYGF